MLGTAGQRGDATALLPGLLQPRGTHGLGGGRLPGACMNAIRYDSRHPRSLLPPLHRYFTPHHPPQPLPPPPKKTTQKQNTGRRLLKIPGPAPQRPGPRRGALPRYGRRVAAAGEPDPVVLGRLSGEPACPRHGVQLVGGCFVCVCVCVGVGGWVGGWFMGCI